MPSTTSTASARAANYYAHTAADYDALQFHEGDEHFTALEILASHLSKDAFGSLLDVGSGTGRALTFLQERFPAAQLRGVEPVAELSQIAHAKGIPAGSIMTASGEHLPFPDRSTDIATAFGVLHHTPDPAAVITEMFRVARRAVFISDHDIYGMGSRITRSTKRLIRHTLGFRALRAVMTRGRGYHDTDYDGVFYPFSLLDHLPLIRSLSERQTLTYTKGRSHLAILAE